MVTLKYNNHKLINSLYFLASNS